MPTVANGIDYDFHIGDARGEQIAGELDECIAGHPGKLRALAYANHARHGQLRRARSPTFDAPHRAHARHHRDARARHARSTASGSTTSKKCIDRLHVFGRIGWNDGKTESFAYTEVDNTVMLGGDLVGDRWRRPGDKLGLAGVTNGLSQDHANYLADGGLGFLLGDGKLRYGREDIVEAYYTARAYKGIFPAVDVQAIAHPGYNTRSRPGVVGSLRLHVELSDARRRDRRRRARRAFDRVCTCTLARPCVMRMRARGEALSAREDLRRRDRRARAADPRADRRRGRLPMVQLDAIALRYAGETSIVAEPGSASSSAGSSSITRSRSRSPARGIEVRDGCPVTALDVARRSRARLARVRRTVLRARCVVGADGVSGSCGARSACRRASCARRSSSSTRRPHRAICRATLRCSTSPPGSRRLRVGLPDDRGVAATSCAAART